MTRTKGCRVPGTTLLRIARLLFDEQLLSGVVQPTIADLQREFAEAGAGRVSRLRALGRGYWAFWSVTLIAPFASGVSRAGDTGVFGSPHSIAARLAVVTLGLALFATAGPLVSAWIVALLAAAASFAAVMHRWYQQHPSELPAPPEPARKGSPQINFSSTEVAGNVGGLIFAVGSVFIVTVGLPAVIWFLFAAVVAGCLVAWRLATWRISHPRTGGPDAGIVLH